MEALGPNLRKLKNQTKEKILSRATVYCITLQVLDRLEALHSLGFVHNDLKLENIVVGSVDLNKIYLIDFGLAKCYKQEDGSHVRQTQMYKFSGNSQFASINSCRGYNKSRRDDIESLLYLTIQMLTKDLLPWCKIKPKTGQVFSLSEIISQRLHQNYTIALLKITPKPLRREVQKILSLSFEQKPGYTKLRNVLRELLFEEIKEQMVVSNQVPSYIKNSELLGIVEDYKFEWARDAKVEATYCHFSSNNIDVFSDSIYNQGIKALNKYLSDSSQIQNLNFRSVNIQFNESQQSAVRVPADYDFFNVEVISNVSESSDGSNRSVEETKKNIGKPNSLSSPRVNNHGG